MKKLNENDFLNASQKLRVDVATIKAITQVESSGNGFNSNGTPKTLFEGHWFHYFTKGKFSRIWKYRKISYLRWTRIWYGKQTIEKKRLALAVSLDREAALKSTSWGKFQLMGFNYNACGFSTIQDFVNAMYHSEGKQLKAFVNFILLRKLDDELRTKNWARFSYFYNGKGFKKNKYDVKLANAYKKFASQG